MDKLVFRFKDAVVKEFPIEKDLFTIGRRPDNDICIENPAVSGAHARIQRQGSTMILEDLNSTNGTFVNQQKITKVVLNNNDVILVGKHTLTYMSDNPMSKTAAPPPPKGGDLDKTMVIQTKAQQQTVAGAQQTGANPAAAPSQGCLAVLEGSSEQKEYDLKARITTIGKAESSNIKLKGLLAPKTGAVINRTNEGYFISPPGEDTKIKVNGNPVKDRVLLKEGDIIEVHGLKMQFFMR